MTKIKSLFSTRKRAIASGISIALLLAAVGTGTAFAAGVVAESTSIGEEAANRVAFADAGVLPEDAVVKKTEFEFKKGKFVYEVEFYADGVEYEYLVNADDGAIVKKETERSEVPVGNTQDITVTLDEAKAIALADAGAQAEQVTYRKEKLDVDDGRYEYEIDFIFGEKKYEYEINAFTGAITDKDIENIKSNSQVQPTPTPDNVVSNPEPDNTVSTPKPDNTVSTPAVDNTPSSSYIGTDRAKEIALSHAGVNASEASFKKVETDRDDGRYVYELEFYVDRVEYEYEIDAVSGDILDWEKEIDD